MSLPFVGRRRSRSTPLFDVAGALATVSTARPAPGWPIGLMAMALAAATATLTIGLAVSAGWLVTRLAIASVVVLALGLTFGSTALVGLATAPMLAAAALGLDRPEGHAWGQTLLLGVLWYVTAELAWGAIEARETTVRSAAVRQLRVREVATVVAVTVVVGLGATALAEVAPTRTVVIRGLAVAAVLACVVGVGTVLTRLATPPATAAEQTPTETTESTE